MCIALMQCADHTWKNEGPFMAALTMINVSHTKSTYDHSTNKFVHLCHTFVLYLTEKEEVLRTKLINNELS